MSADVSDSLHNLILQHANISTFLKHYLDRRINVDLGQNISRHEARERVDDVRMFDESIYRSPAASIPERGAECNDQKNAVHHQTRKVGRHSGSSG